MFVTVLVFEAGNSDKIATGISPSSQDVEGQKLFCAPTYIHMQISEFDIEDIAVAILTTKLEEEES